MNCLITGFVIICDQTGTFVAGHIYHDPAVAKLECETLGRLNNWYTSRLALTYSVKPFKGIIDLPQPVSEEEVDDLVEEGADLLCDEFKKSLDLLPPNDGWDFHEKVG